MSDYTKEEIIRELQSRQFRDQQNRAQRIKREETEELEKMLAALDKRLHEVADTLKTTESTSQ